MARAESATDTHQSPGIRTPDQRLRVFISSTLGELAPRVIRASRHRRISELDGGSGPDTRSNRRRWSAFGPHEGAK